MSPHRLEQEIQRFQHFVIRDEQLAVCSASRETEHAYLSSLSDAELTKLIVDSLSDEQLALIIARRG